MTEREPACVTELTWRPTDLASSRSCASAADYKVYEDRREQADQRSRRLGSPMQRRHAAGPRLEEGRQVRLV